MTQPTNPVSFSQNIQAPQVLQRPQPPGTYMFVANSLMPGIKVLTNSDDVAAKAIPLAILCGQALECGLKAFLSRRDKKRKGGHDIADLWGKAVVEGLPLTVPMPVWADALALGHSWPHDFRYAEKVHMIGTPAAQPMIDELDTLLRLIESKLHD